MIRTLIFNHPFQYELERIIRSFFPPVRFDLLTDAAYPEDNYIATEIRSGKMSCTVKDGEKVLSDIQPLPDGADKNRQEQLLSVMTCKLLEKYTGVKLDWGILTGIRPVKLAQQYLERLGEKEGERVLKEELLITDEKIRLAKQIAAVQKKPLESLRKNFFSLYVSVPFCPARCSYCSFVSHSVKSAAKLIPDYVDKLCEEIIYTARVAKELDFTLDTVYIGGGTPTVLTAEQLSRVFKAVEAFDTSYLREYTVEAGRPDTISREKLLAIKAAGAGRISINPQTMNDSVLAAVGRNHTSADIEQAFALAREIGFDSINADLIAGLPTDTYEGFCDSLERVIGLNPENITVHNLSLKRSAKLYHEEERYVPSGIGEMIAYSRGRLGQAGYLPYYLYRQKNSVENHENIGWAKAGKESLYNIYIMEERQPIFAAGCSGSTKLVDFGTGAIARVYNFKYPYEYLERFDEVLARKKEIVGFYKK